MSKKYKPSSPNLNGCASPPLRFFFSSCKYLTVMDQAMMLEMAAAQTLLSVRSHHFALAFRARACVTLTPAGAFRLRLLSTMR